MIQLKRKAISYCVASTVMLSSSVWAGGSIDELREHFSAARYDAVYEAGQQMEDLIGSPEFDLYYGIAAIETARVGEGVLALERFRMASPHDQQAALHLARGYLMLGEPVRARAELEAILAAAPATEVADAANALLDAARTQESAAAGSSKFYVEGGLGIDNNVNGGVGSSVVTLPVFGQVVLPQNVTQTGDTFMLMGAGAQASRTIEPGLSVFGAIDYSGRLHANDKDYDQQAIGGNVGVTLNRGGTLWRATASHNTLYLENDRYRGVTGLAGEWATSLRMGGMVNAFLQYARFDYGELGGGVRDADFYGAGVGYRQIFSGAMRPTVSLALTFGDEKNDRNRDDYSRAIWGLSGTVSITPLPKVNLSATLMHQQSDYQKGDPLLLATRHDRFDSLTLGATYLIDRNLSLRGEVSYIDNRSNISLYEYDRLQGFAKLRYEF